MLHKLCFSLLLLCFVVNATGQQESKPQKPDYNEIERLTKTATSPYYYSKLLQRYNGDDTTLTSEDFRMLYFGYFFQDAYDAYHGNNYKDSVKKLMDKGNLSEPERKKIILFAQEDLKNNPFHLNDLNILYIQYVALGDKTNIAVTRFKFKSLIQSILSTGDGSSKETAFHVLSVSDEYTFLSAMGLKYKGHETDNETKTDYLTVEENNSGVLGVFFDVSQIFAGYTKVKK